jgi:TP901 family phage tail tape measure protein
VAVERTELEIILKMRQDVARQTAEVNRALQGLSGSVRNVGSAMGQVGQGGLQSFARLSGAFAAGQLAASAFQGAVGGMVGAFRQSASAAADFSQSMGNIRAVIPEQDFQQFGGQLNELAVRLGADLPLSAGQAGQAFEALAQRGISARAILEGAGEAVAALSGATGTDLANAAEIAAAAVNTFGLTGRDVVRVSNLMTGAITQSGQRAEEFALGLSQSGAVARQMGLGIEDVTIALGLFARAGLRGSDAGTSLRTMLLNIIPSTKQATEAMQALGIITQDGTNRLVQAIRSGEGVAGIFRVLREATAGLNEEQRILGLRAIFGTDAVRAAGIAAALSAEQVDEFVRAVRGTDAVEVAGRRMDTLRGDIEKLSGSFETLQISLGQRLDPVFRAVVQTADAFVDSLGSMLRRVDLSGLVQPVVEAMQKVREALRAGGPAAAAQEALNQVNQLVRAMFGAGHNLMISFGQGVIGAGSQVLNAAREIAARIARLFIGRSPPPEGPLSTIDEGGRKTAEAWAEGFRGGMGDLQNVAQGVVDALGNVDKTLTLNQGRAGLQAAANDLEALKALGEDVEGVMRSLDSQLRDLDTETAGLKFQQEDIKSAYEEQIAALQRQADAITNISNLTARQRDLQLELKDLQLQQALVAAEGDPVRRAQLAGKLEQIRLEREGLNLTKQQRDLEQQLKDATSGREENLFNLEQKQNEIRNRLERTTDPDRRKRLQSELRTIENRQREIRLIQQREQFERKRANLPTETALIKNAQEELRTRQELFNLQDRTKIAQITQEREALKLQQDRNKLQEREQAIQRELQAAPILERIRELKREQEQALKPIEDRLTLLDRERRLIQLQRDQWRQVADSIRDLSQPLEEAERKAKAVKDEADGIAEKLAAAAGGGGGLLTLPEMPEAPLAGTGAGLNALRGEANQDGRLTGQDWAKGFMEAWTTEINTFFEQNAVRIIGAAIGGSLGAAFFGPFGAIAGAAFGSAVGQGVDDALKRPELVQEGLSTLRDNITNFIAQHAPSLAQALEAWSTELAAWVKSPAGLEATLRELGIFKDRVLAEIERHAPVVGLHFQTHWGPATVKWLAVTPALDVEFRKFLAQIDQQVRTHGPAIGKSFGYWGVQAIEGLVDAMIRDIQSGGIVNRINQTFKDFGYTIAEGIINGIRTRFAEGLGVDIIDMIKRALGGEAPRPWTPPPLQPRTTTQPGTTGPTPIPVRDRWDNQLVLPTGMTGGGARTLESDAGWTQVRRDIARSAGSLEQVLSTLHDQAEEIARSLFPEMRDSVFAGIRDLVEFDQPDDRTLAVNTMEEAFNRISVDLDEIARDLQNRGLAATPEVLGNELVRQLAHELAHNVDREHGAAFQQAHQQILASLQTNFAQPLIQALGGQRPAGPLPQVQMPEQLRRTTQQIQQELNRIPQETLPQVVQQTRDAYQQILTETRDLIRQLVTSVESGFGTLIGRIDSLMQRLVAQTVQHANTATAELSQDFNQILQEYKVGLDRIPVVDQSQTAAPWTIQSAHSGGLVQRSGLVNVAAGEVITPAPRQGGLTINGPLIGNVIVQDEADEDRLTEKIWRTLSDFMQSGYSAGGGGPLGVPV